MPSKAGVNCFCHLVAYTYKKVAPLNILFPPLYGQSQYTHPQGGGPSPEYGWPLFYKPLRVKQRFLKYLPLATPLGTPPATL